MSGRAPTRQPSGLLRRTNQASNSSSSQNTTRGGTIPRPPSRSGHEHRRQNVPPSPAGSVMSVSTAGGTRKKPAPVDDDHGSPETNINVVVRCRGRNEREIKENSSVVVSMPGGNKGKEVSLSSDPLALSNKTYTFDRAFGAEVDQATIYDEVAAPILEEMLSGYNCTIFAYGQTGTGKTYTMSGDMSDNFGTYADTAGIIPRSLYNLFAKLEKEGAEFTVKCSFIELYNEELRDLLQKDDKIKVKLFDDSNKKDNALVIQGMEESYIKSAEEGVKLLQDGSVKRQVAATKCNDLSSRSHTVFTITVHVKDTDAVGEDMLRTGKLNLVDLAGSENIGRSGAENKRAREAGMINQSLLTLGRVINALVDKSQHIPYRESKLTRLLRDSLGGRTKTCIIATISPAKINFEETMSTLDYAARAKNIRNKPQINQMMTKKALIREYVIEIERLKGDLVAARQKNGVFLTQESYVELTEENESRRILTEEQQRKIDVLETQLKNARENFENTMRMLQGVRKDLEETKEVLDDTTNTLAQTEGELVSTKKSLADEQVVAQTHQQTEKKLDKIGQGLISTLDRTVTDVSALHDKIDRKAQLAEANKAIWSNSQTEVSEVTQMIDREIESFSQQHAQVRQALAMKMNSFLEEEIAKLQAAQDYVVERMDAFAADEQKLVGDTIKAKNEMNSVLEEIKILREDVKSRVGEGLKGLNQAAQKIVSDVAKDLETFQVEVHSSFNRLGRDFRNLFDETQKHIVSQKAENETLRTELLTATSAALSANATAQSSLRDIVAEERQKAAEDRAHLISQITALINASGEQHDRRVAKRVGIVQMELGTSREELSEAETRFRQGMEQWEQREEQMKDTISQQKTKIKAHMQEHCQSAERQISNLQATTSTLHSQTLSLVDAQLKTLTTQMSSLDTFLTRAREHNERQTTAHLEDVSGLTGRVQQSYERVRNDTSCVRSDLGHFAASTLPAAIEEVADLIPSFEEKARGQLHGLNDSISSRSLEEYKATGSSPARRTYDFNTVLPRTLPREKLLLAVKNGKPPTYTHDYSPSAAATVPLPTTPPPPTPKSTPYARSRSRSPRKQLLPPFPLSDTTNTTTNNLNQGTTPNPRIPLGEKQVGNSISSFHNRTLPSATTQPFLGPAPSAPEELLMNTQADFEDTASILAIKDSLQFAPTPKAKSSAQAQQYDKLYANGVNQFRKGPRSSPRTANGSGGQQSLGTQKAQVKDVGGGDNQRDLKRRSVGPEEEEVPASKRRRGVRGITPGVSVGVQGRTRK
ncbi:kinesin-domain-containing protein [Ascobolus immersus RN42]|uniref:Kinesin-domain-containing protein n=1 Tax=Ascobolus immersus RN42 TaxID=1160509 RepID=A0A3N4HUW1_ASCIM|nr:kinesin-domain-containing protein [Ascobolus immersus RN42]